jgi:hypothetical protein
VPPARLTSIGTDIVFKLRWATIQIAPAMDEKDDQPAKRERQNSIRAIRSPAEMQKEDKVNADPRQGEEGQCTPVR